MDIEIVKLDLADPNVRKAVEPFADKVKSLIKPVLKECWGLNQHFTQEKQTEIFQRVLMDSAVMTSNLVVAGIDRRVVSMVPAILFKNFVEDCKRDLALALAPGELKRIRSESAN